MSSDGLDPRHIEEVLARTLAERLLSSAHTLHCESAVVLLRTRVDERFLVRSPVGFDAKVLLQLAEVASTRPRALPEFYAASGYRSWGSFPLEVEGVKAGELHLLSRLAAEVRAEPATALARDLGPLAFALLGLEAARAAEERGDVTAQVARGLLHQLEISSLFPDLIRLVARLCPCDAASVAIYHPERESFELVAVYGPHLPPAIQPGVVIPASETPMRDAWTTGQIVSDPDGSTSPYPRARRVAGAGIASALYIPVGEPRRALLCVGHQVPHRFGDEEVALYRSFVPFLEIALRNAELVGKIRAAYRELDATQERLVRAERLRALGELAAGVAHDVGNALAIVASHAELMARRATDAETREMVASCLRSVEDGTRAVKHVLDMARGETPHRGATSHYVLDAVVREAVLLAAPRAKAAEQRVDLDALLPMPEAPGVAGEVKEAVLNIILNALDATPHGGTVSLATCVVEQAIVLAVEDSGPGVPEPLRERIFEPFFTTKGPGHVGLGLAQVARAARQLGGSVRVTQGSLGGARVELRLPLTEIGSGPHELPRVESPARRGHGVEVLLVEDEASLRNALSALLGLRGHEVVTAGDVNEALSILAARSTIQVVVTDLGLPGRSGWELVDEIRVSKPRLPIVVLSGLGVLTDPAQAKERGVAAVLSKPTSEQDLAATIEHLVH